MASVAAHPSLRVRVSGSQHRKPIDCHPFQPQSSLRPGGKFPSLSLGQDQPRSWRAASQLGAEEAVVEEFVKEAVEDALHVSRRKQSGDARLAEQDDREEEGVPVETRYVTS